MTDRETVIKELENYEPYARVFSNITITGSVVLDALALLKEQEPITCSHCANWIPGKGTDDFHFIPPGCKRHGGMWPGDGFCSYAEKR